ncbi:MAG: type VI secretion system baseplate subunit TssF [Oceanospirillaceae bacterium]|nr:type VI secretion system baseplate subunit TssF [Oceanospirillaceae bacterium]
MDPLLLKYYERELQFVKEMGSEYADEYPKIASRLGIDSLETSDPYVERLYEGFAFLAARVQLRIDAQYPKFTQNLMNMVYPQFLTPTPSMAIVQFNATAQASLEAGVTLERGTVLKAQLKEGEQTPCKYVSAHQVTLWPIKLAQVEYFTNVGALNEIPGIADKKLKAGLRLVIESNNDLPLNEILLDQLDLHFSGQGAQAVRLYEQVFANCCALVLRSVEPSAKFVEVLSVDVITPIGFDDDHSLFPDEHKSFSGYRLLREYFAFSERFLFARISQLNKAFARSKGTKLELLVLFDRCDVELENRVTKDDIALFCTPVINLFSKRTDRIHIDNRQEEFHVVPDRTRPLDFEVFQVEAVNGYGNNSEQKQRFLPFYSCNDLTDLENQQAYFSVNRERRLVSQRQRKQGLRSNYIGSESYISLVDANEAPYSGSLKQLEIHTLCTNRDLPLKMPIGKHSSDFTLDISAPVASIKCLKSPTKPRPSLSYSSGETAWRLINHLSLNYLSLCDGDKGKGAAALRQLLSLYGDGKDAAIGKQIEGLRSIDAIQVTRRLPMKGPIAFGRGLQISVVFDESAFVGTGVFLLGAVLDQFFARYVSINSFTITVIKSEERGEITTWPLRKGRRQIV